MRPEQVDFSQMPIGLVLDGLHHPDWYIRSAAGRALCNRKAKEALQPLLDMVDDQCYLVRIQVARSALHLDATSDQALPVLHKLAGDTEEVVRLYALEVLEKLQKKWL